MFISSSAVAVSFPYPPMSLTHREWACSAEPNEIHCGCSAPHLVTEAQGVKLNQPGKGKRVREAWGGDELGKKERERGGCKLWGKKSADLMPG